MATTLADAPSRQPAISARTPASMVMEFGFAISEDLLFFKAASLSLLAAALSEADAGWEEALPLADSLDKISSAFFLIASLVNSSMASSLMLFFDSAQMKSLSPIISYINIFRQICVCHVRY